MNHRNTNKCGKGQCHGGARDPPARSWRPFGLQTTPEGAKNGHSGIYTPMFLQQRGTNLVGRGIETPCGVNSLFWALFWEPRKLPSDGLVLYAYMILINHRDKGQNP